MAPGLRWGILATGGIARTFTSDLTASGFAVTAVGSRSQSSADEFAARFGITRAHGSYEALVADETVDAVYVATPHPMHHECALLAFDAGKHVLVEKSFTLNASQARELADRAAKRGVVVMEAMWTRFLPHMVRIHEILDAGSIGDVRTVLADHSQAISTDPRHRLQDPELGGGALLDLGIYPVSLAVDLLGLPTSITADAAMTPTGVDRQIAMQFVHEGGRQAVLHSVLDTRGPNRAAVLGTEGWIDIDPVWYTATSFTQYGGDGSVVERFEHPLRTRGMEFQAWELERRVAGEAPASLPLEETVAIMGVLDEIRAQIGLRYPGE
ncbi:MAG: Gfo/Idh/MocA family oxidoreductase [Microcella sp.]|uniref:Gfo/Idh/MocA family protein n=1 Tax=Microcella sp. TaxID=1913979 RepID=UPI00331648C2